MNDSFGASKQSQPEPFRQDLPTVKYSFHLARGEASHWNLAGGDRLQTNIQETLEIKSFCHPILEHSELRLLSHGSAVVLLRKISRGLYCQDPFCCLSINLSTFTIGRDYSLDLWYKFAHSSNLLTAACSSSSGYEWTRWSSSFHGVFPEDDPFKTSTDQSVRPGSWRSAAPPPGLCQGWARTLLFVYVASLFIFCATKTLQNLQSR